jgi:hypothetical protein
MPVSELLNLGDLVPNGIYNMYLVHFDSGLLGTPKKVTFKGYQNGRPLLAMMGGTVMFADYFDASVESDDEDELMTPREWAIRTWTGSCRTFKFSHAHVNLHDYLAKPQHLVKNHMYRMYRLKYDTDWDDDYQLITFKGWTPFLDGSDVRNGFEHELETCAPLLQCHVMRERFLLTKNERSDQWCTMAGERVFFLCSMPLPKRDGQDHQVGIQTLVNIAEGDDDAVRVCAPLNLSRIRYGKHVLTSDGDQTDPVTLTTPDLTRATYIETDCLDGGRIQCLYHHSTLNDLMQRNIYLSPITRKPFCRANILRLRYQEC